MASSITVKIGPLTSTLPFTGTDAQVSAAARKLLRRNRAEIDDGEPEPQLTNQQALDLLVAGIVADLRRELVRQRIIELRASQSTSIEAQAESETQL